MTEHQVRVECALEEQVLDAGLRYRIARSNLVTSSEAAHHVLKEFAGGYVEGHPIDSKQLKFWASAAAVFGSALPVTEMPSLFATKINRISQCFQETYRVAMATQPQPDGSVMAEVPADSGLIDWTRGAPRVKRGNAP